jgi:large subunit ribosomal protein L6
VSRVGKKPVVIPEGVTCTCEGQRVVAQGPKGKNDVLLPKGVRPLLKDGQLVFDLQKDAPNVRAFWGMARSLVSNLLEGVSKGFKSVLEIEGVGYRASLQGQFLNLQLGFSHDVKFAIPEGITITCEKPTVIAVSGVDKRCVGQTVSDIQGLRPPEPYKGKGIRRLGQYILRKEGKKK